MVLWRDFGWTSEIQTGLSYQFLGLGLDVVDLIGYFQVL